MLLLAGPASVVGGSALAAPPPPIGTAPEPNAEPSPITTVSPTTAPTATPAPTPSAPTLDTPTTDTPTTDTPTTARSPGHHEAIPRPTATPPVRSALSQTGLELPGNYLHISPGVGGFVPVADAGAALYAWGLGAGHHFTRGSDFAIDVGGFAEHLVLIILPGEDLRKTTVEHTIRVGPETRIGVRSPQGFAYGLVRVGLELILYPEFDPTRRVVPSVGGMVGGGVQGLLGRRFLLGGEGGLDVGGATSIMIRLRVMVGVRF